MSTTEDREKLLANSLGDDTNLGVAPLSEDAASVLGDLVREQGWKPSKLSLALGMSHTWLPRKIGDDKTNPRICTVADAVKILDFMCLEITDLTDRL